MRPDSARWERAAEVRAAAQGWLQAGAIDQATLDAIGKAFPDPCIRPSTVWRALTAGMVTAIVLCTVGAFGIAFRARDTGLQVLLFLFAGACLVATEQMEASPRLARRGAAGAASFWAVVLFLAGFGLFLFTTIEILPHDALDAWLVAGALAWGASSWRWGNWLFAGFSAASLFVFLGRVPQGRVLCLLVGMALAALAARRLDDASWAPSHRRAAAVLVVTGLIAAYAAVNVYSLDMHLLESLRGSARMSVRPLPGLFVLSAVGTAFFPLVILAWGIRSRRTFLIDTGIVLLGLSLVTLRYYVHLGPLWVVLTVSGAALVVFTLAVERALRRAPQGEISGLTANHLFVDERRQRALQIVPVVAAFTPPAPGQPAEEKGFAGGGGRFGGGGAGEKF
jgi:MFS family permease